MVSFRHPIYCTEYQGRIIMIYCWGDERVFFAQINDENDQPIGAAPKLYETVDDAVDVCKDLIDFLFGDVECYRERAELKPTSQYNPSPTQRTVRLNWAQG